MIRLVWYYSCLWTVASGAKILLATMPQGRSHAGSFMPLMHRLVQDGHDVTVFFEIYSPELPLGGGVKENLVLLKGIDYSITNDPMFADIVWNGALGAMSGIVPFYFSSKSCAHMIREQPDDFWHLANQTWDLVLTDSIFTTCGYALALLNKKPFVLMHSSDVEPVHGYFKAYGRGFAEMFLAIAYPSSFLINNAIGHLVEFSMEEYAKQTVFSFYDMPDTMTWPLPGANDLVSYGAHCKKGKVLPDEYAKFLNDPSSKGTILVAFGTICQWEFAPKRIIDAFVTTLNNLADHRIIWAYKGPKLPLNSHVMVNSWIPQQEILEHPKTKLFISHGGLKSLKEAICSETPVIYMPMFAEQLRNSWIARERNFAAYVNKKNVTAESLERTVRNVLSDEKYQTTISRMRRFFNDRPVHSLDEGSFWFRRLLKYGGKMPDMFYRKGAGNFFVFHYHLDLIAVAFVFVYIISR
uniref:UDP-glucuronosyltransferase n=1 Tax=Plectus sambesii TaxID=2011161 RepID=A0A914X9V8_9BILA